MANKADYLSYFSSEEYFLEPSVAKVKKKRNNKIMKIKYIFFFKNDFYNHYLINKEYMASFWRL
jgi:hypothetical protein